MRMYSIALLALIALSGMVFSSCSMKSRVGSALAAYHAYDRPTKSTNNPGAVSVKVSLSKQRVYVMEGEQMLLAMPVSVGAVKTATPTGDFKILNKNARHRDASHGYAYKGEKVKRVALKNKPATWSFKGTPMPYWCEFKPFLGFHTGWVRHSPCTDGSLRMHENLAPKFFHLVSVGTPVNISYRQPEDARWAEMSLPPDAGPLPDYDVSTYISEAYFTRHKPTGD
jgi:hypothetical protein